MSPNLHFYQYLSSCSHGIYMQKIHGKMLDLPGTGLPYNVVTISILLWPLHGNYSTAFFCFSMLVV